MPKELTIRIPYSCSKHEKVIIYPFGASKREQQADRNRVNTEYCPLCAASAAQEKEGA